MGNNQKKRWLSWKWKDW